MGRERIFFKELDQIYSILQTFPNLFLETSTVPSDDIFASAIKHFGEDRIIFGTDIPFNLIRAVVVNDDNRKGRYLTEYPYNWVNKEEQSSLRIKFPNLIDKITLMHFQNLYAIKNGIAKAQENYEDQERIKNKIFYQNAINIFNIK